MAICRVVNSVSVCSKYFSKIAPTGFLISGNSRHLSEPFRGKVFHAENYFIEISTIFGIDRILSISEDDFFKLKIFFRQAKLIFEEKKFEFYSY